jgi:hypothetical protein
MSSPAPDTLSYVRHAARALGLNLDEAAVARVATHFERTQVMAAWLDAVPLTPEDELAEIYRPAPFPTAEGDA